MSLTVAPASAFTSGAWGVAWRMVFALVFCLGASLLYVAIIRRMRLRNLVLVPVVGLMYGSVLSAIAEFHAFRHNLLQSMQGWLLGDFSRIVQGHYEIIYLIVPIVVLTYAFAHRFTVLGMGEGMATSLGLSYPALATLGLVLVAVTVSATVITVGAIPSWAWSFPTWWPCDAARTWAAPCPSSRSAAPRCYWPATSWAG